MALPGPDLTPRNAVEFGLLGVLAWPMIAGTVRVMAGRLPLRPPWWAALWVFIGVVPTTVILLSARATSPGGSTASSRERSS